MLSKMLYHRLAWPMNYLKRSATVASDFYFANQMKQLNDKKQFKKALQLFDEYKNINPETTSDFIISQALKACTQIGDFQRGSSIHRLLSSKLKNNATILASLIHLYSKFQQKTFFLFFFYLKCNVVMLHKLNYYSIHHQRKP